MMDAADLALLPALDALLAEANVTRAARRLGVSQPAMSARLARLRALTGDALLVPAGRGRGMTPTPHALALRERLRDALAAAEAALRPAHAFDPSELQAVVRIVTHDNAAALAASTAFARLQATTAPQLRLALLRPDGRAMLDWLEGGQADFAIAADDLASGDAQLRRRLLLRDRFVTAQRKGHPRGSGPLGLEAYCALDHLLVAADGGFTGLIDRVLEGMQRRRRVAFSTPSYTQAPLIVASSDLVVTLPSRLLAHLEGVLDLFEPPLLLEPVAWQLLWHARMQDDPVNRWLRDEFMAGAPPSSLADRPARSGGRAPG